MRRECGLARRIAAVERPLAAAVGRRSGHPKPLEHWERIRSDREDPSVSSFHPLVVGNVLLVRTLHDLLAVDFATGKRLWDVPNDENDEAWPGNETESRQHMLPTSADQRNCATISPTAP